MKASESTSYPVWTVPNVVSFLRLTVLLPLSLGLLASGNYGWSLLSLFLLGTSDALDGFLARKLDQRTPLGEELDPLSDRASILLVSLALVIGGLLPWYLFAAIVAVDATLLFAATVLMRGYPDVPVTLLGKVRTVLLMLGLPGLILAAALQSPGLRIAALTITVLGALGHVLTGIQYLTAMFKNSRDPKQGTHSASVSAVSSS